MMRQNHKSAYASGRPRILAISDIHGHLAGMIKLLKTAHYRPGTDRLYLLGDYIDTVPGTWSTLTAVERLCRQGARAIVGNKEIDWLRDQQQQSIKHPSYAFVRGLPWYNAEEKNYLFVHAGVRPGVDLAKQTIQDCTTIREPFLSADLRCSRIVVFGHTPTVRLGAAPGTIWVGQGKIDIDTGAKHHLRLTLVDLTHRLAWSCSTALAHLYGDLRTDRW